MGCGSSSQIKNKKKRNMKSSTLSLNDDDYLEADEANARSEMSKRNKANRVRAFNMKGNAIDDSPLDRPLSPNSHTQMLLKHSLNLPGDLDLGGAGDGVTFGDKPTLSVQTSLLYSEGKEQEQTEELNILNQEETPVFFKIKVTQPKLFLVKPNGGQIAANASATVKVTYRPSRSMNTVDITLEKKVKLMVQGLKINYTDGNVLPSSVWQAAPSDSVSRNVVTVVFLEPQSEELDLTKFMSVQMSVDPEQKAWWK